MKSRLAHLLDDLRATNRAIFKAKHGQPVELCAGCGAITVKSPCPKCKRENHGVSGVARIAKT